MDNFLVESIKEIPSNFVNCDGGGLLRTDKEVILQKAFRPLPDNSYPSFSFDKSDDDQGCAEKDCPYDQAFGQMFRPVFVREIDDEGRFQVVFYDSLRWNRVFLFPTLFASHIKRDE